ncbi:tyrosine-type recombinase/integrase [Fictibacillus sp. 26RED30]|uniref:tyrosine-type recombinase/integrase n=1 Tax=Fictibacillus sp. 26RED30 TaxID=2745877 RepID=UPI0018CEDB5C|nr:tyrosine-type recombinase/integrase [Fictibacillus sp. 26RED30]MBH0162084.1 tyrosine-type recombinase/integrase [Fictibacillus sp. 26RED30]
MVVDTMGIGVKRCQVLSSGEWVIRWIIHEDGLPLHDVNLFLYETFSSSTAEKYAYNLVHFFRYLKQVKIHYKDINDIGTINYYVKQLLGNNEETKITYAALKTRLNTLHNFYEYLITRGKVSKNPIVTGSGRKSREVDRFLKGIVEPELKQKLAFSIHAKYKETRHWLKWYTFEDIELISSGFRSYRDKLIFGLSIETGMRIGEILGLRVCDFSFKECTLAVKKRLNPDNNAFAKTGSRVVPISNVLASSIVHYLTDERLEVSGLKDTPNNYLFLTKQGPTSGKALKASNYRVILKAAGARVGYDKKELRTHSGRSTRIQQLLDLIIEGNEKGESIITEEDMEKLLGLKSASFKHYKKPFKARLDSKLKVTLDAITPLNKIKVFNEKLE